MSGISSVCLTHLPHVTLESGIYVGQGTNVGPGKFDKNNKHRALNKCRAWKIRQKYVMNVGP